MKRIIARANETGIILHTAYVNAEEDVQDMLDIITQNPIFGVELVDYIFEVAGLTKAQIEAQKYLNDTDWLITRLNDPSSGRLVPDDILIARTEAREIL